MTETGFTEIGFNKFYKVKFRTVFVDLLEVEGKFDKVIAEDEESFDCENLLKALVVILALRKYYGILKIILSS